MRAELLYLQDIIDAADSIDSFLEGISKDDFFKSNLIQSAVLQKLMVVGEASGRISAERKLKYLNIPWKQIVDFRNIAIHAYFTLDLETVWTTAIFNIPVLKKQISEILQNDFPDFEGKSKS